MKVVLVSSGLASQYGGAALSEAGLASHLQHYVRLSVLCREDLVDFSFAQAQGLHDVHPFSPREAVVAWKKPQHWMGQLLRSADVVHLNGHWRWEYYFIARLCQELSIPYLLHPRGMLLVGHRRPRLKRGFNALIGNSVVEHAAKIIALSRFETEQFAPYSLSSDQVAIIPNGISIVERGIKVTPRLPFGTGSYFLYLGRLEARKNLIFLIDAFAKFLKRGHEHHLVLIGPVERGYDSELLAFAEKKKIENRLSILPPVYDMNKWNYLKHAVAVIYPTVEEPFGRVPFETIAAGGYPIIPSESGSAEYLRPFLPHSIYEHQNRASLVKVLEIAAERQGVTADLKRARTWVKEALDWNQITRKVLDVYEEVSSKRAIASTIDRDLSPGRFAEKARH